MPAHVYATDEHFTILSLSGGKPKEANQIRSPLALPTPLLLLIAPDKCHRLPLAAAHPHY